MVWTALEHKPAWFRHGSAMFRVDQIAAAKQGTDPYTVQPYVEVLLVNGEHTNVGGTVDEFWDRFTSVVASVSRELS